MNDDYTDGIICPYEIPDQWQYEYDRQWYVGNTLKAFNLLSSVNQGCSPLLARVLQKSLG